MQYPTLEAQSSPIQSAEFTSIKKIRICKAKILHQITERTTSTTLGSNKYERKLSMATNYFIHTALSSHEMTPNILFAQKMLQGHISTKKYQIEQTPAGQILLRRKEKPQSPLKPSKMTSNIWLQLGD